MLLISSVVVAVVKGRQKRTRMSASESVDSTSKNEGKVKVFDSDVIFTYLGKYGWFQFKYLMFTGYGFLFMTASILIYTFVGGVPAYRCFVDGCDDSIEPIFQADWLTETAIENMKTNPRDWSCNFRDFDIIPNVTTPSCAQNYTANATCSSWVFDKSVFTRTIVNDYLLVCNDSWKITFGTSITMLGVLCGAFLLGPLPDVFGRRKSTLFLGLWMSLFGISSCFAPNFESFAGLRFISSMGGVACMQAFVIWGLEAMPTNMRIPFICILFCFKSIGNMLSGLIAYFIRDWVVLQLCLFVPMGTLGISYFFLPESTRWLTAKKRYAEAKEIYEKAAKLNKKEIPAELLVIPSDEPKDVISTNGVESNPVSYDSKPLASALKVMKTRCLLSRLLILCGTWFAQFICYYGLTYASSNLSADIHFNFFLATLVELPAYVLGMFAMDYLGRRLVLNFTLLGGGIFCLVAGLVSKEYNSTIVVFSLMGKFCTSMLFVANNAFTYELFPTVSRGILIGICSTCGKLGAIIAPFISGLGTVNPSVPYVVFGIISFVIGVLTLWLPETAGKPVPATVQEAIDFENTKLDFSVLFGKRKVRFTKSNSIELNSPRS